MISRHAPSAAEYQARVERAGAFAGRMVASARNAARLLASVDPDIHHGEAMTCVWRAETAACRAAGLPGAHAPDESECRSSCANLAYTDRDIAVQRKQAARLAAAAGTRCSLRRCGTVQLPRPPASRPSSTAAGPPMRHQSRRQRGEPRCAPRPGRRTRRHPRGSRAPAGRNPLRSATGKMTGTELITESGLRRDVVFGDHKGLVEEFQAQVKAQQFTLLAALDLVAERDTLAGELTGVRQELARERAASSALRRIAAELAIELDQARSEWAASGKVTRCRCAAPNHDGCGSFRVRVVQTPRRRCGGITGRDGEDGICPSVAARPRSGGNCAFVVGWC